MTETLHIYTRVSTITQEDNTSLETQKSLGIKTASNLGYSYKIWNEGGVSSSTETLDRRPVLLSLINRIQQGEIKHLFVSHNDRLSRNEQTGVYIKHQLSSNGVILHTKDGQFDLTNHLDNFIKTIIDSVSVLDNAVRADRSRRGKLEKVKQGFWHGGPSPFGYLIVDKKLDLHPEQSEWVNKMYTWTSQGKTISWIRSKLEKSGVKTKRGNTSWTDESIRKILTNTHPKGFYIYTCKMTGETFRVECKKIVDTKLATKCEKVLARRSLTRNQSNRSKNFYLLSGLLYCGHCKGLMGGRIKPKKHERLYYCRKNEKDWKKETPQKDMKWVRGKNCSMVRSLNIPKTDKLVTNTLLKEFFTSRSFELQLKKGLLQDILEEQDQNHHQKLTDKVVKLDRDLDRIRENIAEVEVKKRLATDDVEVDAKILKHLYQHKEEVEQKTEQARVELNSNSAPLDVDDVDEIVKYSSRLLASVEDYEGYFSSKERQKNFLRSMIDKIYVHYDESVKEHELIFKMRMAINPNQTTFSTLKKNERITMKPVSCNTPQPNKTTTVE
jgi:DNA invertase Pin-like site-specific DNA recombinase